MIKRFGLVGVFSLLLLLHFGVVKATLENPMLLAISSPATEHSFFSSEGSLERSKPSYRIALRSGESFPEPLKGLALNSYFSSVNLPSDDTYVLIQFETTDGDPTQNQINVLEEDGIRLFNSIPGPTYFARVPSYILRTKKYDFIRWVGILRWEQKIDPDLKVQIDSTKIELFDMTIHSYEPLRVDDLAEIGRFAKILKFRSDSSYLDIRTDKKNLQAIASLNFVKWMTPFYLPTKELYESSNVVSSDVTISNGRDASTITIGLIDDGIRSNHTHFNSITIYRSRDFGDNDSYPEAICNPGTCDHGTRIAGIISGFGSFEGKTLKGISNKAPLVIERVYDINDNWVGPDPRDNDIWLGVLDPDNDSDFTEANSSDIISISWGNNGTGSYTPQAKKVDEVVLGDLSGGKGVLVVKSVGNAGPGAGTSSPGTAKNALTVGASADYRASSKYCQNQVNTKVLCDTNAYDNITLYAMGYSSNGTSDGRVKPDILAPGSVVTSSTINGSNYTSGDGTSFAAPHATAIAAQVLEHYASYNLPPSSVKSFLIANAVGGGTTNQKDYRAGWGRVESERAVYKLDDETVDIFNSSARVGESGSGYPDVWCWNNINIPSGSKKFIATMVYSDKPGDPVASQALVNDLDLYIRYPNNTVVPFTDTDDSLNNVEKYVLEPPILTSGDWDVCVSRVGNLDGSPGTQDFSINYIVVKETQTPSVSMSVTANTTTIERSKSFSIYGTPTANGLSLYDMWGMIEASASAFTLLAGGSSGSDANKSIVGDISVGRSRNTNTWEVRGDTYGSYSISVSAFGNRIDDTDVSSSASTTITIKRTAGDLCSGASECYSSYCAGSSSYSARCCSSAPSSDGWYGGGDAGCGTFDDPASSYRDYYCDSSGTSSYEVTSTTDCDTSDAWLCATPNYQHRDYYALIDTNSCSYCVTETLDSDINQSVCESCGGYAWNSGGEINATVCCGDDSSENKITRQCAAGICTTDSTDDACCTSNTKCVYSSVCYSSGYEGDVDSDGQTETCDTGTWYAAPNDPPVLGSISNISADELTRVEITASATDPDGDTISYSINDSRFSQNGNVFTWWPTCADSGIFAVNVSASDGILSDWREAKMEIINSANYDLWIYNTSRLSPMNTNGGDDIVMEFLISNCRNDDINGVTWGLQTNETNMLSSNLINLSSGKTAAIYSEYSYSKDGTYNVTATANSSLYSTSNTTEIIIGGLLVKDAHVLAANNTRRLFEFTIINNRNVTQTGIQWSFDTGESVINNTQNITLSPAESATVYIEHNYTSLSLHETSFRVLNSNSSYVYNLTSVAVGPDLKAINLSVLNSTGSYRLFELTVLNNGTVPANVSWRLNISSDVNVTSAQNMTLSANELAYIYSEYAYAIGGLHNITGIVDVNATVAEINETNNMVTISD